MQPEGSEPILPALDLPRTRAFYELLGFKAGYHDDRYEILRRGQLVLHLEHTTSLEPWLMPLPGMVSLAALPDLRLELLAWGDRLVGRSLS